MIKESFDKSEESANASLGFKIMLMLAIATSIDALAVGVTFAFLEVNIWWAISFIRMVVYLEFPEYQPFIYWRFGCPQEPP